MVTYAQRLKQIRVNWNWKILSLTKTNIEVGKANAQRDSKENPQAIRLSDFSCDPIALELHRFFSYESDFWFAPTR